MRVGNVAIIGQPNVGKSTLLNALLKEKVAIVSDRPQTTRTRILGVVHLPEAQLVLLDTPGLHKPEYQLNKRMVRTALDTMREADLLYVMVEATRPPGTGDQLVLRRVRELLARHRVPVFLLLNKVDLVKKPRLLPLIERYCGMHPWTEIVPISAEAGVNLDRLLALTVQALPEGEPVYDKEILTDQSMRTLAAEIVREKILRKTRQELPYVVAVEITEFVERKKSAHITATIFVEKDTQKPIVIGARGERLKTVGTEARLEMERLFGFPVFLELWVRVKPAWREDEGLLVELGY